MPIVRESCAVVGHCWLPTGAVTVAVGPALHDGYLASSGLARIVGQVQAKGSERDMHDVPGFPGFGDHYPGPAVVVIEPERRAVGHRLLDGRDDLRKQVVVGEVDLFCAVPRRPGTALKVPLPYRHGIARIGELEDSSLVCGYRLGSTFGGSPDLRITSVFSCVSRGSKARASLRFTACCSWRSLAVDGGSGASQGHGHWTVNPLLTVRISNQLRAWFNGPWRCGGRAWSAGFGVKRRRG